MKADSIAREFAKKYEMPSSDVDEEHCHDEDEIDYYSEVSLDETIASVVVEIEIGNGKFTEVETNDHIADLNKDQTMQLKKSSLTCLLILSQGVFPLL